MLIQYAGKIRLIEILYNFKYPTHSNLFIVNYKLSAWYCSDFLHIRRRSWSCGMDARRQNNRIRQAEMSLTGSTGNDRSF